MANDQVSPARKATEQHDEGCDCENCFYEARQSGKPDPKPGKITILVFEGEEHKLFPPEE